MSHIAIGLALLCLIVAIPAFFSPQKFRKETEDLIASGNTTIRLFALFNFIVAFLILNTHWTIKLDSNRSIMTVIGYLLLLRGITEMWFPEFRRELARKILHKEWGVYLIGFVTLIFALGFGYLGFKVY